MFPSFQEVLRTRKALKEEVKGFSKLRSHCFRCSMKDKGSRTGPWGRVPATSILKSPPKIHFEVSFIYLNTLVTIKKEIILEK